MSERVRFIYLFLVFLLVVEPHIIQRGWYSIPRAYILSVFNLLIIFIGYFLYVLYKRDIRNKEKEKKELEEKLHLSTEKLNDAFKYIGLVNRRLPLLQDITSGLMLKSGETKNGKKQILNDLLATAVISVAKTDWGIFRFIDKKNKKTIKEFIFTQKNYLLMKTKISNDRLLDIASSQENYYKLGKFNFFATSDRSADVICFLIFPGKKGNLISDTYNVLQNVTDQAQLFFKYLYAQNSVC
jgi:hypothetical protein